MTTRANDAAFTFDIGRNAIISLRSWGQVFIAGRPSSVHYSDPSTLILLALCMGALILLVIALLRSRGWRVTLVRRNLFRFSCVWFLFYFVFLFFWLPHNTFYKLFALPAIILGAASCEIRWLGVAPTWRSPAVLFVTVVALFNLTFAIIPYSRVSANQSVEFAFRLRPSLQNGAIVYFWDFNGDDWFVHYFNPQTVWRSAPDTATIDAELRAGKFVWLDTTAIDRFSETAGPWLAQRSDGAERHELVNAKHRIRFVRLKRAPGQ